MSQHDFVIDNGPGLAVRQDINAAIQALVSVSSGPVEPTVKSPGMLWLDTSVTNGLIRQRNLTNDAWIPLRISATTPGQDIHALPAKTVPADADEFPLSNSASTPTAWASAKITFANLRAAIVSAIALDKIVSIPADMAAAFRSTGTPRFVVNSKADLTGTDVLTMDEAGNMTTTASITAAGNVAALSGSLVTRATGANNAHVIYQNNAGATVGYCYYDMAALLMHLTNGSGALTLNQSGDMSINGMFDVETYIRSTTTSVVLATASAGTCYLRPNGYNSAVGQFYVDSAGNASANGSMVITAATIGGYIADAIAAMPAGGVGTYGLFRRTTAVTLTPGAGIAGSSLVYSNASGSNDSGVPAGSWRTMGSVANAGATTTGATAVFLRYA